MEKQQLTDDQLDQVTGGLSEAAEMSIKVIKQLILDLIEKNKEQK